MRPFIESGPAFDEAPNQGIAIVLEGADVAVPKQSSATASDMAGQSIQTNLTELPFSSEPTDVPHLEITSDIVPNGANMPPDTQGIHQTLIPVGLPLQQSPTVQSPANRYIMSEGHSVSPPRPVSAQIEHASISLELGKTDVGISRMDQPGLSVDAVPEAPNRDTRPASGPARCRAASTWVRR